MFIRIKRFPANTVTKHQKRTVHNIVAVREYEPECDKEAYLVSIVPANGHTGFDNLYIQSRKTLRIGRVGQVAFGATIRGLRAAVCVGRTLAATHGITEIWVYSSQYRQSNKHD